MKWDAWGDPAAAKPLSDGVRSLLKQVVGLADSEQPELDPAQVQLRPSALSGADHDALARIVGTEYFRTADRDRLLHAGGKSTPDLLRRKDTGVQDAPDAVLLPGGPNGEDAVADILHYCSDHGIAVVPFGGGTSVVGGLDPVRNDFRAVISLDMRRFDRLHRIDEVSGEAELEAGVTGPEAERLLGEHGFSLGHFPQSFEFATIGGFAANRIHLEWDSMGTGDQLAMGLPATRRHNRICPSQIDHGLHARSVRNPHRRLSYRYRQRHV